MGSKVLERNVCVSTSEIKAEKEQPDHEFRLKLRSRDLFQKLSFYLLLLIFQVASCGTNAEVAAGLNTQASSRSLVQTRFVFKLSLQDYTIASITFCCKEGC